MAGTLGPHDNWKQTGGKKKGRRGRRAGWKTQKTKVPLGTGIYNINGTDLSEDELKVLDKGLKFAPVWNFNKFQTYIILQKFIRTLNIKKYFLSKPGERSAQTSMGSDLGIIPIWQISQFLISHRMTTGILKFSKIWLPVIWNIWKFKKWGTPHILKRK